MKYELSTFNNASFVSFLIKALTLFRFLTLSCLSNTFIQTHKPIDCVFVSCHIRLYSESTLLKCPNIKELPARNRRSF